MTLTTILDKARDVRTLEKMKSDIEINTYLGRKAMKGLCDWLCIMKGYIARFEYYTEELWNDGNMVSYKQDADLIYKGHTYPVEVKVTRFAFPERIFVRKSSIDKLGSKGYLYLSEGEIFCVLKKDDVESKLIEKVEEWGNKKCYILIKSELEWSNHLERVF